MKVLVCGDRNWEAWPPIWRELRGFGPAPVVIHGDARGADKMAGYVARQLGHTVRVYPADWTKLGKAAGPLRNQEMLDAEHVAADPIGMVLAFHDTIGTSKGTADMVKRARAIGVPVRVICSTDE